jgi:hypothetical protein
VHHRRWSWVLAALIGCGNSSGNGSSATTFAQDTTCGAAMTLAGAIELRVPPSRTSTACGTQTSFESGIDTGFLFVEGELSHVDLEVDDVREGETGGQFPARLRIVHDDGREWRSEQCMAEIAEHVHVGPAELGWERYRLAGSVACDDATSVPAGSGPALEVQSFDFVVTVPWG